MTILEVGPLVFGLVIGWVTYRTLRRQSGTGLSDIATVIGAVGGAAITGIFADQTSFAWYCVGLGAGFFLYLIVGFIIEGKEETGKWMSN